MQLKKNLPVILFMETFYVLKSGVKWNHKHRWTFDLCVFAGGESLGSDAGWTISEDEDHFIFSGSSPFQVQPKLNKPN